MRERFLDFIEKHALIGPGDRVLLAISGGLDSMAMLHLFSETKIPFAIAHCNFSLRGEESDGDQAFVKDRADELGVPCFLTKFDTKAYAKAHQCSTQMAARDLRYNWFAELLQNEGYQKVATAHHLNDSFETVLFNLAKGTSISGLRGILPRRDQLIRPMLGFSRKELQVLMEQKGVSWREDSSNKDTYYQRNFIRANVVEPLMTVNPDLLTTFQDTAARNREVEAVFAMAMEQLRASAVLRQSDHISMVKSKVNGPYVLEQLLKPYGFSYGQAKDIWSGRDGLSGSRFVTASHTLVVDRDHFVITVNENSEIQPQLISENDRQISITNTQYDIKVIGQAEVVPELKQEKHALLDLNKLSFPLRIRSWQEGDYFQPLGMKGKKKLSDFMIDHKIPVNLKSRIRVVESAGKIAWVVGYRVDDRFKVTPKTEKIFCLLNAM